MNTGQKWLQNQLETYHIPSVIRKNNLNVPKKSTPYSEIRPDLTGGKVLNALHKELEESQFLIVICSPKSASSEWVSREIQHFIELGQGKIISFPLLWRGTVFKRHRQGMLPGSAQKRDVHGASRHQRR